MNLNEFHTFKLSDAVKFHDKLNPKLFKLQRLDPAVKKQLLTIAKDFMAELGISGLNVEDITISGSNAAYTYTDHSDLDLHILVDMSKLSDDEVYKELFSAKKTVYNDSHNITIRGIPVELYVQDSREPVVSLGEYSLLKNKWLKLPTKRRANFDQNATKAKYDKLMDVIDLAFKTKNEKTVDKVIRTVKRYRQAGLDRAGEFGPENLAYKALRSQGVIQKLYDLRDKVHSKKLSIENTVKPVQPVVPIQKTFTPPKQNPYVPGKDDKKSKDSEFADLLNQKINKEDYDPNGPPPGPEFKPTMPAGTVRVDVSDVYDWYKLGQNISNLAKADKSQFGKGPPSTIMAFGSEDMEHKYIEALKQLGLDTTDIDPVDPKQPKGMPRQKVDPTYNVNEELRVITKLKPQLFVSRQKTTESLKPDASAWTSTAQKTANGYTSEWVEWCKHEMPDWLNEYGTLYDVAPGARILQINSDQEAIQVARHYGMKINDPLDLFMKMKWHVIARDYDAIHHVPTNRMNNMYMRSWDVESTAWFNPEALINPRRVKINLEGIEELNEEPEEWRPYQGLRPPKNELGVNLFPGKDIVGKRVYHCTNSLKAIQRSGVIKPRPDETGAREYGRLSTNEHPFIPVVGVWFSVGKPDWPGKYCLSFVIEPSDEVYVAYAKSNGDLTPNVVLNSISIDRLRIETRDKKSAEQGVAEAYLVNMLSWPEIVNKVNSAMKAMGWKGQRKDDNSFMFSTKGQEDESQYYIVVIENEGNGMFHYALGTFEDGRPDIGEQNSLPNTEASVSELMNAIRDGYGLGEQSIAESRGSLFSWLKQQFPTWPDYVVKDFLYQQAKTITSQEQLADFLEMQKKDFGKVKWRLEKLPITLDIFTPKTQRMIKSREGGSSNPFKVPKDAERHAQQLKMIQQHGVRTEPIIVAKLSNGYDLIEGWHRTIQHLKAFPEGYTGPAWVGYGATYTSEIAEQGVTESASGYIPSNAEKDDPRFKTALTVDIKPDTMKKDAKKFGNKISRAGIPPKLNTNGKF